MVRYALCLAALACLAPSCSGQTLTVLAWGQSNAASQGTDLQPYAGAERAFSAGRFTTWREGVDPFQHAADPGDPRNFRGSPYPHLATRMSDDGWLPRIVMGAWGGTILQAWAPGGTVYTEGIERVSALLARPDAVLFLQGESNRWPLWFLTYEEYKAALFALADALGADLDVPLVVGVISSHIQSGDLWRIVETQQAQRDAALEHPNICPGPETTSLGPLTDGLHFTTDAQLTALGALWWDALGDCLELQ